MQATTEKTLDHAIVLGGSAAGLFAARVLAQHAERVTLVERDAFPEHAEHRKGTPQSRHANNLLPRALPFLDAWFPGVIDELQCAGAVVATDDVRVVIRGVRYARTHGAPPTLLLTRPLLDKMLSRRVRALPNVRLAMNQDVIGLCADGAGNVTGVKLLSDDAERSLTADLVVDAMGRGTRTQQWLSELGHPDPAVTRVQVDVRYATRLFSRTPADLEGDKIVLVTPTAERPRGAVAFAVEGDRWLVTLFGYGGETPRTDLAGFKAFAHSLVASDIAQLLSRGTPLDDGASFVYPTACLRRFDKVRTLPNGYLRLGDSLCHLNPSYGQGITSAALQAEALATALRHGSISLPRRYYKLAISAASHPFELSWSADLDLPSVIAPPNPTPAPIRAYLRRAMRAAGHDATVALAMRRIIGLLDPPPALLRPSIAFRVLFATC